MPFALGLIEIIALTAFFILMVIGTIFDRRGTSSPKWYLLGLVFIAVAIYYWDTWSLAGVWSVVTSWQFWYPVGVYLAAGLFYSSIEFGLTIRRAERELRELWVKFIANKKVVAILNADGDPEYELARGVRVPKTFSIQTSELITDAKAGGTTSRYYEPAVDAVKEFVQHQQLCAKNEIITVNVKDALGVEPVVKRSQLAEYIGAWTFLWPAYAVSLVLGDLLFEMFTFVANIVTNLSSRIVRMAFRDTFST